MFVVLAQQHFLSLLPTPLSPPVFFSNVQHILFWAFAFSHLYIIFLTHAGCPPAADPSLQELLQPLIHLDRQLQLAASVVDQLKDLEDGLETIAAPNVLPLVRRCIQWLERGIHEMRLYRFLLFYQLPRALQLSFQRHQRPPLTDLDFN